MNHKLINFFWVHINFALQLSDMPGVAPWAVLSWDRVFQFSNFICQNIAERVNFGHNVRKFPQFINNWSSPLCYQTFLSFMWIQQGVIKIKPFWTLKYQTNYLSLSILPQRLILSIMQVNITHPLILYVSDDIWCLIVIISFSKSFKKSSSRFKIVILAIEMILEIFDWRLLTAKVKSVLLTKRTICYIKIFTPLGMTLPFHIFQKYYLWIEISFVK